MELVSLLEKEYDPTLTLSKLWQSTILKQYVFEKLWLPIRILFKRGYESNDNCSIHA